MAAFGAGFNLELNLLALLQGFISLALNCRVMDEHIRTTFWNNKTVTFLVAEPLYFTLCHYLPPRRKSMAELMDFVNSNIRQSSGFSTLPRAKVSRGRTPGAPSFH